MKNNNFQTECTSPFCLWVEDVKYPNQHFVCLKCTRERWINRPFDFTNLVIIVSAISLLILLIARPQSPQPQPPIQPNIGEETLNPRYL
ncbi:hypothetical protein PCC9214_02437 [Planktothrix tepida]|uniref:Uncharacterized protein n=2 Tax=Planktothrix TaxID=54304 RepID=A0A1J1LIZ1_9CYAN|nr:MULTISPECIES: hypothetical protein [Planktothrix]CAD5949133.1 hypothetical protein PCC9214_02437 [Planktothrix tepida]CAD5961650.1 hypothetical protein NO713_03239 [Planktothrix pseudagardhii]CUR32480.1 conserved hypothetical protein [Planktothrix tepida PCC 9214]